jgi:hypothetical protein
MSLAPLSSFLNKVYCIINEDREIKNTTQGVYLSINPKPTYPFIFISINKTLDQSNLVKYAYSIDLDVSIFFQEKAPSNAVVIANYIDLILKIENFSIDEYKVLGLKKQDIALSKSLDALTQKLSINYLSFIRQK